MWSSNQHLPLPPDLPLRRVPLLSTLDRSAPQLWPLLLAEIHLCSLGWSLLIPEHHLWFSKSMKRPNFSGYLHPLHPPSQSHKNHLPRPPEGTVNYLRQRPFPIFFVASTAGRVCDTEEATVLKCGLCQDVTGILHQCGKHAEVTPLSACLLALTPLCNAICLSLGEAMTHSYPAECDSCRFCDSASIHTED